MEHAESMDNGRKEHAEIAQALPEGVHAPLGLWQVGPSTHTHLWARDIVSLCKLPRTETWHHPVRASCLFGLPSSAESLCRPLGEPCVQRNRTMSERSMGKYGKTYLPLHQYPLKLCL